MGDQPRNHLRVAACVFEVQADGAVQLLPAGQFRARDGRPEDAPFWFIDADIAAAVIDRASRRETPLVIDYEHQTLAAEVSGNPAPAAGFFRGSSLEWREDQGLFVTEVDWTDRARRMIEAGEYRFISPVFSYQPGTGVVRDILLAALTNVPALDGMAELSQQAAARALGLTDDQSEDDVDRAKLIQALGLAKDATDQQIEEAVAAAKAKADQAVDRGRIAKALGLAEDASDDDIEKAAAARSQGGLDRARLAEAAGLDTEASDEQIVEAVAAARSGNPDPRQYAPVETVEALRRKVAELEAKQTQDEVEELVQAALSDGRLLAAQESWARELGHRDLAALRQYVETARPIAALRGTQTGGKPPVGDDGKPQLTESQIAVCRRMGISEEDYRKQLEAEQAEQEA